MDRTVYAIPARFIAHSCRAGVPGDTLRNYRFAVFFGSGFCRRSRRPGDFSNRRFPNASLLSTRPVRRCSRNCFHSSSVTAWVSQRRRRPAIANRGRRPGATGVPPVLFRRGAEHGRLSSRARCPWHPAYRRCCCSKECGPTAGRWPPIDRLRATLRTARDCRPCRSGRVGKRLGTLPRR